MAQAKGDAMSSYRSRLVTVSASYGAGGSVVAPALAERLGVPFLQRATTSTGGSSGPEPCFERLGPEEAKLTPAHRLLASPDADRAARPHAIAGPRLPPRREPAAALRGRHPADGGRRRGRDPRPRRGGGARQEPRLPRAARRACRPPRRAGGRDRGSRARTRPAATWTPPTGPATPTSAACTGADPTDTRHYHLVIDSTAISLDTVTELILQALASAPDPDPAPVPSPRVTATGQ